MILLGSQVGTPANWAVDSNFDTMMALKSMSSRYSHRIVHFHKELLISGTWRLVGSQRSKLWGGRFSRGL